ncbi:MAG: LUD domain-containing protein [Thermomicrobiales bacterium]|nr:LUD domain-containing protein [Thermomicrobiales bacterium]
MVVATDPVLTPNEIFAELAPREIVSKVAVALEANGFNAVVVENAGQAREAVLALLPEDAEIFEASSTSLEAIGVIDEINSGRYRPIRPRLMELYAQGDRPGMRRIAAAPDVMLGSVQAVTERGEVIVGSGSGSQLGPYAYTAGSVIWVVGAQKIVRDLDEGMRRLREYSLPLEDVRSQAVYGFRGMLNKILILNREPLPGRTTVILVNEALGF